MKNYLKSYKTKFFLLLFLAFMAFTATETVAGNASASPDNTYQICEYTIAGNYNAVNAYGVVR